LTLIQELKRRNVFRVAIGYAVLAWLVAQVAELFLEAFGAPAWALKTLLLVLLLGFPLAVFFAWAFELTPEGLKKESEVDRSQSITMQTGRKLDRAIILVLVLALAYFAWDKFMARPGQPPGAVQRAEVSAPPAEAPAEPQPSLPTDKSIAVLPFENRSRQEEDEFFTSGIHDDLLTQLAQISALRVISRTSVAQFKDTTLSIREIAETLGVATILEGGVQRAGNQVRINMQLIDAATDAHLWAQTFDRELTASNIFSIQSDISTAVTDAMRATLTPDERKRIRAVPTENMAALELYFKGRAELDQRTLPALESARLRFEEARRLDPDFALAWAGEALAIELLSDNAGSYGEIPAKEAMDMALPLIEQAYRLAPDDPQVLAVYGLLERDRFNIDAALDYYRRSLAIQPSSGEVLNWQRMAQANAGMFKESLETAARMVEVDPMSMIALYNATASFVNSPYDDPNRIEELLVRLEGLSPGYGLSARANVAEDRGQLVDAVRHYYRSIELDPGRSAARDNLADLLENLGLVDEAMKVDPQRDELDEAIARLDRGEIVRLARELHERDPDSRRGMVSLMYALAFAAGKPEEAMPIVMQVWREFESIAPTVTWFILDMAWIANEAEYPAESRTFRDVAAQGLKQRIDAGNRGASISFMQARLARLDGRIDDMFAALGEAIDGGFRDPHFAEHPAFLPFADELAFQSLASRMRDVIATERDEIVAMLCGPEPIVQTWQPAAETCALYPGEGP
jgi:TolB-like protein